MPTVLDGRSTGMDRVCTVCIDDAGDMCVGAYKCEEVQDGRGGLEEDGLKYPCSFMISKRCRSSTFASRLALDWVMRLGSDVDKKVGSSYLIKADTLMLR